MKSLNKRKVSADSVRVFSCLANFEILATFKDGHHSKEGQLENGRPKTRLYISLLDYTCITLGQFIWEEIRSYIFNMAIMCPKGSLPKTAVLTYHADYILITKNISH